MKKAAIVQSNYIPWKGYFDLIASVDEFILYDDMQYTRRDWRNRNRIKTSNGLQWLTIPVEVKGRYHQKINETRIADASWARKHWNSLRVSYSKAAAFDNHASWLETLYLEAGKIELLSEVNALFIRAICEKLDISTRLSWSSDYHLEGDRSARLRGICEQVGATRYVSGPAARDYLDEQLFANKGIEVSWMDYSGYAEYPQLHGEFEHGVTVLDLVLNVGDRAQEYMMGVLR